ncbi:LPS assembly protein LptD [Altererythrobacter sp. SALINAS58]|uniref:LPS-assembly protein LptD n=1 Tax=Alteripontixanthobacter muriae TaxID=2705546 RepID=UPI001575B490|nr:LPS assembly protein LptD [Alteripontixanthobacter muriae]NTZ42814.1 LPS assembly protein LptD [Alteripontixanthobacter muriae]
MPTPPPSVLPALAGSSTNRSSIHRQARLRAGLYPLASAAVLLGFCSAAPLAAQEGAAPGTDTAIEPVELPDPRDLIYAGEENPGLPQPVDPEIIDPDEADDGVPLPEVPTLSPGALEPPDSVDFSAAEISYDNNADTIVATGNVVLTSEGRYVRADRIVYDRASGQISGSGNIFIRSADGTVLSDDVTWEIESGIVAAEGNVRFEDANGNRLFTDRLELTDRFETGSVENLLLALVEGGRLAARQGERLEDGNVVLTDAAYSACAVTGPEGCDKTPSWRITADRAVYDPDQNRVRFTGAYLEIFGARLLPLPGLSLRTDGGGASGFLIPDVRLSESNGLEISGSYYWRLADNKDLTASAYLFTDAPPMVSGQFRQLTDRGAYQITGYLTQSRRVAAFDPAIGADITADDLRGYIFANGSFQLDENWSLDGVIRLASDRTFLRRYDISREDRLRSTVSLERVDEDSYFQVAGWGTQTLRLDARQGQVPLALPVIDYRRRIDDPLLGGQIELHANTLALFREDGQNTQRAFAGGRWDLRRLTRFGQAVTFTALARADLYHSSDNALTESALYRGNPGWQSRAVALGAVDVQWPLIGTIFGGTQVLTPRVQFVATPPIRNLAIPNEDSRAIDLEDTNLFSLNRFPGYDRFEDGARVTYGFDWQFTHPGWRLKSTLGQSYRLDTDRNILPDGTGLSERVSDIVGRTEIRYRDYVKLTHRFRLDKDSLAVRRNEFDATVGSNRTYVEVGYLRLDRDIALEIEDLQDREEARVAARVAFANYWSVFGSGVLNLTNSEEDPLSGSDGFQPIRTRLGVAYQDDCLELGLTWRRDYVNQGDARRGDTFQLYFALRNLGFR